jgi:hypothetical protein
MSRIIILIAFLSFVFPATAVISAKRNSEANTPIRSLLSEATVNRSSDSETPLLLARKRNKGTRSIPPGGQNRDWGEIRVPGNLPSYEPLTFTQSVAFQVIVRDPEPDGGIENINFQIQDSNGNTVYGPEDTDIHGRRRVSYCPFGGNRGNCRAFVFARHGNQWKNGTAIADDDYTAKIVFNRKKDSFTWTFNFKIQLPSS